MSKKIKSLVLLPLFGLIQSGCLGLYTQIFDIKNDRSSSTSAVKNYRVYGPGLSVSAAPTETGALSISHFRQVLNSTYNIVGMQPSQTCRNIYETQKGSQAVNGEVNEFSSSRSAAITAIAFCACDQLVTAESAANAQRKFFNDLSFVAGAITPAAAIVDKPLTHLARSAWGRDPSQQDRDDIMAMLSKSGLGGTMNLNATQRNKALLMMCGVVLSDVYAQLQ